MDNNELFSIIKNNFEENYDIINNYLGIVYPISISIEEKKIRALDEFEKRYPFFNPNVIPKIKFKVIDNEIIYNFVDRKSFKLVDFIQIYNIPPSITYWNDSDDLISKIIEYELYLFKLNSKSKENILRENFDKITFDKQNFYNEYRVINDIKNNKNILEHPSKIVETQTLYNIELPLLPNNIKNLINIRNWNGLSKIQVETILYIIACHEKKLTDLSRNGYLIADSTGLGKTREILGVILYNYEQGRKKCLWISASNSLFNNTKNELKEINNQDNINIFTIDDKEFLNNEDGILYITYKKLISSGKKKDDKNRFEHICKWLGDNFEGVIIFDECHYAKGFDLKYKSTKTGLYVFELQKKYKDARIIYSSASFASEIKHLAYMNRLGIWNKYFNDNFNTFKKCIETGGFGAIELMSCELKKNGSFCSRNLSYENVNFDITNIDITIEQEELYNKYVNIWNIILNKIQDKKSNIKFWNAHQRFFLHLILSFKIDKCIEITKKAIKDNKSVVIGLFSTGESSIKRCQDEQFSTLKEIILNFVNSMEDNLDIINKINNINFPDNPIDELIDKLGGRKKVCEISGRNNILTKVKNGYRIETRDCDEQNLLEMEYFQNGKKDIAIITEAASIGISLHATDKTKKRIHIIIQLPWSAEKALQQLGRTHRSNQSYAPHYNILFSKLAGEKRLISTIASRLSILGAITNGDRRSSANSTIFNKHILCPEISKIIFSKINKLYPKEYKNFKPQKNNIKSFLNRLLGLPPKLQETIFNEFIKQYDIKLEEKNKLKSTAINEVEAISIEPYKVKNIYNPIDDKQDSKILYFKHKGCVIIGNILPFIEEIINTLTSLKKYNHTIYDGIQTVFVNFENTWKIGCLFSVNLSNTIYQCIKTKIKRINKDKYNFINDKIYEYLIDYIIIGEFDYNFIYNNSQKLNLYYSKFEILMNKNLEKLKEFYKNNHLGYIDETRTQRIFKNDKIDQIIKKYIKIIALSDENNINDKYKELEKDINLYFEYYYC